MFGTVAGYGGRGASPTRAPTASSEEKHRRLIETEAEMRQLATTDPLTGLANRRRFLAAAQAEVARAAPLRRCAWAW